MEGWGVTCYLEKKKGQLIYAKSFRGILVSSAVGKAFHSSLRRKAAPILDRASGPLQIGGRAGQPVQLANQAVRVFQADMRPRQCLVRYRVPRFKRGIPQGSAASYCRWPRLDDRHVSGILGALGLPSDAYEKATSIRARHANFPRCRR